MLARTAEVGPLREAETTPSYPPDFTLSSSDALSWLASLNMSTGNPPPVPADPTLPPPAIRDVLRVCLSAKEYRFLHESVLKRAPTVQRKFPSPSRFDVIVRPKNRHSEAALRASLRVFAGTGIAYKLADLLIARFQGRATEYDHEEPSLDAY